MKQTSSIYWADAQTAERAKELAQADDKSVSALVSALINELYTERFPEPPIYGNCPSCRRETRFEFFAYWHEFQDANLYICSKCRTTLTEKTINDWNKEKEQANV